MVTFNYSLIQVRKLPGCCLETGGTLRFYSNFGDNSDDLEFTANKTIFVATLCFLASCFVIIIVIFYFDQFFHCQQHSNKHC